MSSDLLITGGTVMVGSAFKNVLPNAKYPTRKERRKMQREGWDFEYEGRLKL